MGCYIFYIVIIKWVVYEYIHHIFDDKLKEKLKLSHDRSQILKYKTCKDEVVLKRGHDDS